MARKLICRSHVWEFPEYVSAAGWISHNELLIASQSRLFTFHLETSAHVDQLQRADGNDGPPMQPPIWPPLLLFAVSKCAVVPCDRGFDVFGTIPFITPTDPPKTPAIHNEAPVCRCRPPSPGPIGLWIRCPIIIGIGCYRAKQVLSHGAACVVGRGRS